MKVIVEGIAGEGKHILVELINKALTDAGFTTQYVGLNRFQLISAEYMATALRNIQARNPIMVIEERQQPMPHIPFTITTRE
jgi:hypothetical protein